MTLTEVQRRALKKYPALTWLGKPGELPDAMRWRWDELKRRGHIRRVDHDGRSAYVLTGLGEVWLSDFWRREVIEPYLRALVRTFGLDEVREQLPTLDGDVQRVAMSLWPTLMI
ncbi:hypothetical protein [Deinococcus rubellus]|uniref:hypothetical protein n=1 Tax=Deinococcus rubellus TaxID=1889240 RepID=UPI0031EC5C0B